MDRLDGVALVAEPVDEVVFLGLALREAEVRGDEPVADHNPGVGREGHVGRLGRLLDQLDGDAEPLDALTQASPLIERACAVDAVGAAHPRVDLVVDPVVHRLAHEDAARHRSLTVVLRAALNPPGARAPEEFVSCGCTATRARAAR